MSSLEAYILKRYGEWVDFEICSQELYFDVCEAVALTLEYQNTIRCTKDDIAWGRLKRRQYSYQIPVMDPLLVRGDTLNYKELAHLLELNMHLTNHIEFSHDDDEHGNPLHKKNKSGVTGVHWVKNTEKWRATICIDGKQKTIGSFESMDDAIAARQEAEKDKSMQKKRINKKRFNELKKEGYFAEHETYEKDGHNFVEEKHDNGEVFVLDKRTHKDYQ